MPTGHYERTSYHREAISKSLIGKPKSESHKKAISLSKMGEGNPQFGKHHSEEWKNNVSNKMKGDERLKWNLGNTTPIHVREKISKSLEGVNTWSKGENNHHWKGGISPERKLFDISHEWLVTRNIVRKRDKFCFLCNKPYESGHTHDVHHVIGFQDEKNRLKLDNLILLCKPCHKKIHGNKVSLLMEVA